MGKHITFSGICEQMSSSQTADSTQVYLTQQGVYWGFLQERESLKSVAPLESAPSYVPWTHRRQHHGRDPSLSAQQLNLGYVTLRTEGLHES